MPSAPTSGRSLVFSKSPGLSEPDQAWLLHQAAVHLHHLGRLTESLEATQETLERNRQWKWENAATVARHLSKLKLTLGELAAAVRSAEESIKFADRSGNAFQRMANRTTLADARHQSGARADALALFRGAEAMQAEQTPKSPLLFSLRGFEYCDLLLGEAEPMAWAMTLPSNPAATDTPPLQRQLDALRKSSNGQRRRWSGLRSLPTFCFATSPSTGSSWAAWRCTGPFWSVRHSSRPASHSPPPSTPFAPLAT